jgi:hypothetical protein
MSQTYKLVHGIDKVERVVLFNYVPKGRTRLAADPLNMRVEQARTDVRKQFYAQRIINNWNMIPSETKSCKSVDTFKTNYRSLMKSQTDRRAREQ